MDTLNVKAEQVLFVGDSEVDIRTAQNAGVDVCFVTWGFRKKKVLSPMSHHILWMTFLSYIK